MTGNSCVGPGAGDGVLCGRPVAYKGHCRTHHQQQYRRGAMVPIKEKVAPAACSFPGCGRVVVAKRLCHGHYKQHRRGQALAEIVRAGTRTPAPKRACSFGGCPKPCKGSQDVCAGHYEQRRLGKPLTPLRPPGGKQDCNFPGCTRQHDSKGWCNAHRQQADAGNGMRPIGQRNKPGPPCATAGCDRTGRATGKWVGLCPKCADRTARAQKRATQPDRVPGPVKERKPRPKRRPAKPVRADQKRRKTPTKPPAPDPGPVWVPGTLWQTQQPRPRPGTKGGGGASNIGIDRLGTVPPITPDQATAVRALLAGMTDHTGTPLINYLLEKEHAA